MAFDFKKEYKEFYLPSGKPQIVKLPPMNYIAFRGKGNPNEEGGEYKAGVGLLYGIAYTLKMSKKGEHKIDGYFDYVVPPLEGLWWIDGLNGMDYSRKEDFSFISMIRLPDFVSSSDFEWAKIEAERKKKLDFSRVEFFSYDEGLCVQMMHTGAYDDEPVSIALMEDFIKENNLKEDFSNRFHHEIYLSDPRKGDQSKLKTVLRHPVVML